MRSDIVQLSILFGLNQSHVQTGKSASMVSSKALCVLQTVHLHFDWHYMVPRDHSQAQDSGFTLWKCVWEEEKGTELS